MYQINYGTWRRTVPGDNYIIVSRLGSPGDFLLEHWWYLATDCTPRTLCNIHCLLPPANEVCEGYVFTRVYHSVPGGVSRPRPRVEVKESGQGGSRPTPGGIQVHTWGVVYPSMHWGRTPPSRQLLLRAVRILLECILVYIWNQSVIEISSPKNCMNCGEIYNVLRKGTKTGIYFTEWGPKVTKNPENCTCKSMSVTRTFSVLHLRRTEVSKNYRYGKTTVQVGRYFELTALRI